MLSSTYPDEVTKPRPDEVAYPCKANCSTKLVRTRTTRTRSLKEENGIDWQWGAKVPSVRSGQGKTFITVGTRYLAQCSLSLPAAPVPNGTTLCSVSTHSHAQCTSYTGCAMPLPTHPHPLMQIPHQALCLGQLPAPRLSVARVHRSSNGLVGGRKELQRGVP